MLHEAKWPSVAVLGAGAVGSYFGGMLARAGAPVTLIGRNPHVETIGRSGLFLDSIHFQETVRVAASIDAGALSDAEIVLICVKSYDTEEAARNIAANLSSQAIVVSLQNGVDNVELIRAASEIQALAAAVYVSAELSAPGRVKHTGAGSLVIGDFWIEGNGNARPSPSVRKVVDLFSRAAVPCRASEDIRSDLWVKLAMNCAYNAISALCQTKYKHLSANSLIQQIMRQVVVEIVAVAEATRVNLPATDSLMESALKLGVTMANAISSTGQDLRCGRRTEIDSLNGYVVRQGGKLGVAAPANQTLHGLVKLMEESRSWGSEESAK